MATKTWAGGAEAWDNAADWSPQGEPTGSDDAVIGAGANVSLPSSFVEVRSISLAGPTAVLELRAANSAILTTGAAPGDGLVDGGIAFLASPDASKPAALSGFYLTLGTNLTVDVTGAGYLGGGRSPFEPDQVTVAPGATVNVAPGSSLSLHGDFRGMGTIHVASGTLDLSDASLSTSGAISPFLVQMDDDAGTVALGNNSPITVKGFRAGDVLDLRNYTHPFGSLGIPPYPPGPFQAEVNGGQLQVSFNGTVVRSVTLAGLQAPGATYQAVLSGANDIQVTTTAQPTGGYRRLCRPDHGRVGQPRHGCGVRRPRPSAMAVPGRRLGHGRHDGGPAQRLPQGRRRHQGAGGQQRPERARRRHGQRHPHGRLGRRHIFPGRAERLRSGTRWRP